MKKILFLSVLLSTLVFAGISFHAFAEESVPEYQNVRLWVNPEYDDPRLLVMMQGNIAGVDPPAIVSFLVPSTAEMYSAGSIDTNGQYTGGPPDRVASNITGWDKISYEITTDTFRVEYYDPIIFGDTTKSIAYEFRTLTPISNLEINIQEPLKSSDYSIVPEGRQFVDGEGFTANLYTYSNVLPGTAIPFAIDYTRTETLPSLSVTQQSSDNKALLILIAVLAVAALGGGFIWYRNRKPGTKSKPLPRKMNGKPKASKAPRQSNNGEKPGFCNQCGNKIGDKDKYCPNCGAVIHR